MVPWLFSNRDRYGIIIRKVLFIFARMINVDGAGGQVSLNSSLYADTVSRRDKPLSAVESGQAKDYL